METTTLRKPWRAGSLSRALFLLLLPAVPFQPLPPSFLLPGTLPPPAVLSRRFRDAEWCTVKPVLISWLASCVWLAIVSAELPQGKGTVERLKADVSYLASDRLEGRGISTRGIELAARHIRAEFKRLGLRSGPADGSYYQPFDYEGHSLHNVVGVLEGRGEVASQTVIIGAHYDHLGYGPFGSLAPPGMKTRLHPGADDNASGVATLLELARRFAARRPAPRRRMLFIAFSAEERGEIGSRYYVSREPLFPIHDTVAMLNFDMVGRLRNDELGIAGNETAREFNELLASAGARSHLKPRLGGPEYPDDSDHGPFAKAGIPILYFCTGTHADRHTPADTADKINYLGMAKVVDFAEAVLDRLLFMPRPAFVPRPKQHEVGDGTGRHVG
jgi:hypothetical protein